jgi:hypothetical protein
MDSPAAFAFESNFGPQHDLRAHPTTYYPRDIILCNTAPIRWPVSRPRRLQSANPPLTRRARHKAQPSAEDSGRCSGAAARWFITPKMPGATCGAGEEHQEKYGPHGLALGCMGLNCFVCAKQGHLEQPACARTSRCPFHPVVPFTLTRLYSGFGEFLYTYPLAGQARHALWRLSASPALCATNPAPRAELRAAGWAGGGSRAAVEGQPERPTAVTPLVYLNTQTNRRYWSLTAFQNRREVTTDAAVTRTCVKKRPTPGSTTSSCSEYKILQKHQKRTFVTRIGLEPNSGYCAHTHTRAPPRQQVDSRFPVSAPPFELAPKKLKG